MFDWRKILSGKQGVRRGRQPVNEAARRTASLLRQPRKKLTGKQAARRAACGDRQRKKLTGNQAARRMACGVN